MIAHALSVMVSWACLMGHAQPETVPAPPPAVPEPEPLAPAAPTAPAAEPVPEAAPGDAYAPFAPAGAAYPAAPPDMVVETDEPERPKRFVFAYLPSLTFGLSPFPSINNAFFLGGRVKSSRWAVGFQFTLSFGLAERYLTGLMTHRYHVTGLTSFGANGRGFASFGGGAAFRMDQPMVEIEGRLGYRFGAKKRGIVGAVARIGYDFYHREGAPVPQLGVVIGVSTF